jgi:rhodanese-related sulfurtransferase
MQTPESPVVVDVRRPSEWAAERIGTVVNIPLNELNTGASQLDRRQRVVAVCNSAYRSSLAVGILERQGFRFASSMAGGGDAWFNAGLPMVESGAACATTPVATQSLTLPERIDAVELNRRIMDLPGTFELLDIRPADHFADFHLPTSVNVAVAETMANPKYLTGTGPLIIVDRDGSLAMMVAGILSQKTDRPIKALFGGLQAYWDQVGVGAAAAGTAAPAIPMAPASRLSPTAPPQRKKRRSAGC